MDLSRERLEERELMANTQESGMMTVVLRVVLCMKLVVWTGLLGKMMGARLAARPGGEPE